MNSKNTITAIAYERIDSEDTRNLIPGLKNIRARVVELRKDVLAESLGSLVSDVYQVINRLPKSDERAELESISVAVQVNAEGGAAMVISANVSVESSITLTFKIKKPRVNARKQG